MASGSLQPSGPSTSLTVRKARIPSGLGPDPAEPGLEPDYLLGIELRARMHSGGSGGSSEP